MSSPSDGRLSYLGTISLVNAGDLDEEHPQSFYQFALIDPLDTPFARFRYYYRPWGQNSSHLHLKAWES